MSESPAEFVVENAKRLLGTPYIWGGNDPEKDGGLDCSGLVLYVLRPIFGLKDMTADSLMQWCIKTGNIQGPDVGALLFFGSRGRAEHVAIAISPREMIEAGGGTSATTKPTAGAFVRIKPIKNRSDFMMCVMPNYPEGIKWKH